MGKLSWIVHVSMVTPTLIVAAIHALALNGHTLRTPALRPLLPRYAQCATMASLGGVSPNDDVLASFRLMGLDIDATYDEVESVFADLLSQCEGDAKRKIKLQVAKDRIVEFRLEQAMSGRLQ